MNKFAKNLIKLLKKLPIDIGQAEQKHHSAGKQIACSFVPKVPKNSGKTALDIGCRDGYWSEWLRSQGYRVTSIDIDPHYPGAIQCDVNNGLPFKTSSFDLVFCTEVIEHLLEPSYLLEEIDRVLKPKGKSIITTPNSNWFLYWILKPFGWTPALVQNSDHKHFFSELSVKAICSQYSLYGYFPYMLFYRRIKTLIGLLSPTFILIKE